MKYETSAKRLRLALSENEMKPGELAQRSGVLKSSISHYMNGTHAPSNISSAKMAAILGVSPLWLMGFDVPMKEEQKENDNKIPVLGRVAAGIPIEAIQDIIDIEEISEDLAKTGEFIGLQIHGHSMEPRICDGDVVIVRRQEDAESGEIVIATVNGDDATCKKLIKHEDGISLVSLNPAFEPMFFTNKEIEEKPVRIIGKVVELRGKF